MTANIEHVQDYTFFNSKPFLHSKHFLASHNLKFSQRNNNKHYKVSKQPIQISRQHQLLGIMLL